MIADAKSGLAGQVVIITGAARGLGVELVRHFASCGAKLLLSDISAEGLVASVKIAKQLAARCFKFRNRVRGD